MKKLKHGSKILGVSATSFADCELVINRASAPYYIHPTIVLRSYTVRCAMEDYKDFKSPSYLDRARRLILETGSTLYLESRLSSWGVEVDIHWQMNRNPGSGCPLHPDSSHHYTLPYACKISHCGFNNDSFTVLSKLSKKLGACSAIKPKEVLDGVRAIGGIDVQYVRSCDSFIHVGPKFDDDYFEMPSELRLVRDMESAH